MRKLFFLITTAALFALTACEGSFVDPGMKDSIPGGITGGNTIGGGGFDGGGGTGGGGGGNANVVGTWTGSYTEKYSGFNLTTNITYVFKADGTLSATTETYGIPMTGEGTYTVSGNTVRITNTTYGTTDSGTIRGNTMTVPVRSGSSQIGTVTLHKTSSGGTGGTFGG